MVQPTFKIMQINISSNYKRLSRSLDQVGRKQLPFAFAKTLNETMKAVEKGGVVDLEKARWYLDRLIYEEISG